MVIQRILRYAKCRHDRNLLHHGLRLMMSERAMEPLEKQLEQKAQSDPEGIIIRREAKNRKSLLSSSKD
jgi:hypothetical protein